MSETPRKQEPLGFRLDERVALVTGAAGHLGAAIARALAEVGAHVILNGRTPAKLDALAEELASDDYSVSMLAFDVTDEDAVRAAIAAISDEYGRLDAIVNNAYAGSSGTMATVSRDQWADANEINVVGPFSLVWAAIGLLRDAARRNMGGASVVNVASMYGLVSPDPRLYGSVGHDSPPQYGASKAALLQLTRYMACHLARDGIRVNSVTAGPFPKLGDSHEESAFLHRLEERVPMQRVGRPAEIGGAVVFLVSDAASFVTGANIVVDGGWTAW